MNRTNCGVKVKSKYHFDSNWLYWWNAGTYDLQHFSEKSFEAQRFCVRVKTSVKFFNFWNIPLALINHWGMRMIGEQRVIKNFQWFHFFTLHNQIREDEFNLSNIGLEMGDSNTKLLRIEVSQKPRFKGQGTLVIIF